MSPPTPLHPPRQTLTGSDWMNLRLVCRGRSCPVGGEDRGTSATETEYIIKQVSVSKCHHGDKGRITTMEQSLDSITEAPCVPKVDREWVNTVLLYPLLIVFFPVFLCIGREPRVTFCQGAQNRYLYPNLYTMLPGIGIYPPPYSPTILC